MDNYYHPREQQCTDENGYKNFDLMSSIDIDTFKKDLDLLSSGHSIKRIEYVYNNENAVPSELIINPAPIILVEGLFIFSESEIYDKINLKILINAKDVIKVIRRIHRDKVERNYPVEDVIYRYQHHVLPAYEIHIAPFLEKVDLIVNNNENFDESLEMLSFFIHQKAVRLLG